MAREDQPRPHHAEEFFIFYYMLTGVHLLHVLLGMLILGSWCGNYATPPHACRWSNPAPLLAHGRPALGRHLRPALPDEVTMTTATTRTPPTAIRDHHLRLDRPVASSPSSLVAGPRPPRRPAAATVPITVVVVLGLVKGRMIIRYFMEVRHGAAVARITTDAWLIVLWTAIWRSTCTERYLVERQVLADRNSSRKRVSGHSGPDSADMRRNFRCSDAVEGDTHRKGRP